jgi:hypothetical protein
MRLDLPRCRAWAERRALPLCLVVGGGVSMVLGIDRNWDLQNYHLVNALAAFGGRPGDIAPAGMQSFFNPAADLPFLALLRAFNRWPLLICFLMGLPAGLAGWQLWRLAGRVPKVQAAASWRQGRRGRRCAGAPTR